jgi:hypothetical protein
MLELWMLELRMLEDASEDGNRLLRGLNPFQRVVWCGCTEL